MPRLTRSLAIPLFVLLFAACQGNPLGPVSTPEVSQKRQPPPPPPPPPPPAAPAIAFSNDSGLSVMNADGTNQGVVVPWTRTFAPLALPRWSPDGTRLLFASNWIVTVSVVNGKPAGSNLHQIPITLPAGWTLDDAYNAWTPAGDSIAVSAYDAQSNGRLYTVAADGGPATLAYASPVGSHPIWPDFSPDGSKLVFVDAYNNSGFNKVLVVLDRTSSTRSVMDSSSGLFVRSPRWSHGGDRIAYSRFTRGNPQYIYTIPAAGGPLVQVVAGEFPAWSPDDLTIAYMPGASGNGVSAVTVGTGVIQILAKSSSGYPGWPDWRR